MSTLPQTHRALRQDVYAQPPTIQEIPTPRATPGSAVLKVELANIISYTKNIYNGDRQYPYPVPLTIGSSAIGRVVELGPDATTLKVGDLCILDVTIRGRDDVDRAAGSTFLSAIHEGGSEASKKLMAEAWRDGAYAEYVKWPLENCFVLNEDVLFKKLGYRMGDLMQIMKLMVPYGGMGPNCIDLKPGETIVVAPASGGFGSAAAHLAVELGAGRVIIMGRNMKTLEEVRMGVVPEKRNRVETLPFTGRFEDDLKALKGVGGDIDVFFDISPPEAQKGHIKAAVVALKFGGRVCVMGGGMQSFEVPNMALMHRDITIKGKWMYEPIDVKKLIALVETGVVKLHREGAEVNPLGAHVVAKFKLEEWEKAFDEAERIGSAGNVVFEP
jgi:threonine dehydrogenase-like Zn-dependent dehydrogenase